MHHNALAYAAAWAALARHASALTPMALLPWPEMVARAIESDGDHRIKLVDSCRRSRGEGGILTSCHYSIIMET